MLEAMRGDSSSASLHGPSSTPPAPPTAPTPTARTAGPSHLAPDALLCDLVADQAARTPSAPAIRQWDTGLTYRDLIGAATALSLRLRALGVGPEDRVGLCARRTPLMTVAVLGIMMAGGAYVPSTRRIHAGGLTRCSTTRASRSSWPTVTAARCWTDAGVPWSSRKRAPRPQPCPKLPPEPPRPRPGPGRQSAARSSPGVRRCRGTPPTFCTRPGRPGGPRAWS